MVEFPFASSVNSIYQLSRGKAVAIFTFATRGRMFELPVNCIKKYDFVRRKREGKVSLIIGENNNR